MPPHPWVREFAGSITVCDPQGIILEMNEKSATTFAKEGGRALIGSPASQARRSSASARALS